MDGYKKFVGELVRGGLREPSASELNGLLHWLVGRSNEAARAIQQAFNAHGIPEDIARRHTLAYLDQTLFRHHDDYYRLFGLTPDCSFIQIRRRHKQLLQVFHPDRHAEDAAWFTEKTEEINLAYAHLSANHGKARAKTSATRVDRKPAPPPYKTSTPSAPKSKPGLWRSIAANKGRLRQVLKSYIGSPRLFERRLYIVLYSVPLVLVLLIYMNHTVSPVQHSGLTAGKENPAEPHPAEAMSQPHQVDSPKVVASTMGGAGAGEAPQSVETVPIEEPVSPGGRDYPPSTVQTPEGGSKQANTAVEETSRTAVWTAKTKQLIHGLEAPTSPQTAERPAPAMSRNADSVSVDNVIAVRELLNQYQVAYNTANPLRLNRLFHEDAVNVRSKNKYDVASPDPAAFGEADRTKIFIRNPQVQQITDRRFDVTADYSVDRTSADGDRSRENGRLEMRLLMVDGEPRIRHVQHIAQ